VVTAGATIPLVRRWSVLLLMSGSTVLPMAFGMTAGSVLSRRRDIRHHGRQARPVTTGRSGDVGGVGPTGDAVSVPAAEPGLAFSPRRWTVDPRLKVLARLAPAGPGPVFWPLLWGLALAAELASLAPLAFGTGPPLEPVDIVYRLIGGSFTACGLVAWRRRPDSRSGVLMTATGFGFFVFPVFFQLPGQWATTIGLLLAKAWLVPFAAVLLTLTTAGRLGSRLDQVLVVAFFVGFVGLNLVWLMLTEIPGNLLTVTVRPEAARIVDLVERWVVLTACIATAGVIVYRFVAATPPLRRALAPGLGGAVTLLVFAAQLVDGMLSTVPSTLFLWSSCIALLTVPVLFLIGLLRSRLARAGLADLFRTLPSMGGPELQQALRQTVDDPGLTVMYREVDGSYTDVDGAPLTLTDDRPRRRLLPITRDGTDVAALIYDVALDEDPELLELVHAAASVSIENAMVQDESARRLAELQSSRARLVSAADTERHRLERNLHDGAQQRLVSLRLRLGEIRQALGQDPAVEQRMSEAMAELAQSLDELRDLARGLHPAILEHGLPTALESLATRSTVPTELRCAPVGTVPAPVELAVYFVAAEALTNVAKHSRADRAEVEVTTDGSRIAVEVADNGAGGAAIDGGTGLRGLRDRVEALNGILSVRSAAGGGTVVRAELPLVG
jgi:signal transduction histidine kinase